DRLDAADESRQHAEHARLGAGWRGPRRRRLREEAAVAGPLVRREDRRLSLELEDAPVDVDLVHEDAGVVHEVARREVVAAVDDDVVVLEEALDVLRGHALAVADHLDVRIEAFERELRRLDLRHADAVLAVEDLSLQVRAVDDVVVDDPYRADAGRCEIIRDRRAEPAGADAQDLRVEQLRLPFLTDLGKEEMTAVALDLIGAELPVGNPVVAGTLPGAEAAAHGDDVLVTHLAEG